MTTNQKRKTKPASPHTHKWEMMLAWRADPATGDAVWVPDLTSPSGRRYDVWLAKRCSCGAVERMPDPTAPKD